MSDILPVLTSIVAFIIVVISSKQIAQLFRNVKLPVITGFLLIGVLCGPYSLDIISFEQIRHLSFLNEVSFAFIAFAAGSELYLKEIRNRAKSIKWIIIGQTAVVFIFSSIIVFLIANYIPFIKGLNTHTKIAISLLIGVIFVARSPVSSIAVINEMRAKGPFTQTAMGVTIISDVIVIILFTICFAIADALVLGTNFSLWLLVKLISELLASFFIGIGLSRFIKLIFLLKINKRIKAVIILVQGYSIYLLSTEIHLFSQKYFNTDFYIEPLLICIVASFIIINYFKKYRREFLKIIHDLLPIIYIVFFTLIGTSISINILLSSWKIALLFFLIRLVTMGLGSCIGGILGGDPMRFNRISWMPHITQAGIALSLTATIAAKYTLWGQGFYTILVSAIVINEIIGPPLFKFSILKTGESHLKASYKSGMGKNNAIIFGLEGHSLTLARQLITNKWKVKIVTFNKEKANQKFKEMKVEYLDKLSLQNLKSIGADKTEAIITMLTDNENFKICELAYENFGTKDMIVLVHERRNIDRFNQLGALIVEPTTAMIGLLDHLVRSPQATSLILGQGKEQDTIDVEIGNPNIIGLALRDLRLPSDVVAMGNKRHGNMIISTGYTRLRKGDILTLVGSIKSLERVRLKLET